MAGDKEISGEFEPHEAWAEENLAPERWAIENAEGPSRAYARRLQQELHKAVVVQPAARSSELENAEPNSHGDSSQEPVVRDRSRVHRRTKRLSFGFVATAAAVWVMVLWPAQKGYSFGAMRQKMTQESFVRAQFRSEAGDSVAWVSRSGQFTAVESLDSVWLRNRHGALVEFDRGSASVRAVDSSTTNNVSTQLATKILRVMSAIQSPETSSLLVQQESWKSIELDRGADIELTVLLSEPNALESNASEADSIDVRFGIASKTELPQWMEIVEGANPSSATASIQLNYPGGGPSEIASLGVTASVMKSADSISRSASAEPSLSEGAVAIAENTGAESSAVDSLAMAGSLPRDRKEMPEEQGKAEPGNSTDIRLSPAAPRDPKPVSVAEMERTATRSRWLSGQSIDVPGTAVAMTSQIESRLNDVWEDADVNASAIAGDHTLVRRVYLDLLGRIPRVSEIRRNVGKGALGFDDLVEELLLSPDFDTNMAAVWTHWLLPDDVDLDRFGGTAAFSDWLADEFRNETRYDEIVRRLLLAEGRVSTTGPVLFTTALEMKPEHLAKQTSRVFLGTRIDCAMCHDHPFDDWSQEDFWGYAALFARISRPSAKMDVMSPVLRVRDVGKGEVMLPETEQVVPPKLLGGEVLKEEPGSTLRRRELADWMTSPKNRQFARATVNRVWSHFFGAGLVEPADDFGTHNPALSQPLLEELSQYFVESEYDIRELIRAIVRTSAYRHTSLSDSSTVSSSTGNPLFNAMPVRWLRAGTLYDCFQIASGGLTATASNEMQFGLQRVGDTQRDAFIEQFGGGHPSPLEFQTGIPQALAMMNGPIASAAASEAQSRLILGLNAPFFTNQQRIETVFLSIVGRPPSDQQKAAITEMIENSVNAAGSSDVAQPQVLSDVVWALFNSSEFATNH